MLEYCNKKAFQYDVYRPFANHMCFNIHQVSARPRGPCTVRSNASLVSDTRGGWGEGRARVPSTVRSYLNNFEYIWGSLFSEVQVEQVWTCVTWDPPCEQTDTIKNITFTQLYWRSVKSGCELEILTSSFAACNKPRAERINEKIPAMMEDFYHDRVPIKYVFQRS